MNESNRSIRINYIMNTILSISSFIFPIVTFPYVSRILKPDGIGKVQFATSIVTYFNLFAQLGIPVYGVRAVAKVRDNKSELTRVVHELLIINIVMSIFAYICLFLFTILIPRLKELKSLLVIISSTIMLTTIGMEWLYKGLEDYTFITIRSLLFKLIAMIATFKLINSSDDYLIYGLVSVISSSAANILGFIHARKIVSLKIHKGYDFNRHLKAIFVFLAMAFATTIYTNLDTVMLGFIKNDYEVGIYNAATKVKRVLISFITSLGTVLLPRLSYYIEKGQLENFKDISKKSLHYVLLLSIPTCIYFMVYAEQVIALVSGKDFLQSVIPMQIIMPTIVFIGITNVIGMQIMIPLGSEKTVLTSVTIGAFIDMIINIILMPKYGAIGAAIGTLIAEMFVLVYQTITIKKESFDFVNTISLLQLFVASGVSVALSFYIVNIINTNIILFIIITGTIHFVTYFGILFIIKNDMLINLYKRLFQNN